MRHECRVENASMRYECRVEDASMGISAAWQMYQVFRTEVQTYVWLDVAAPNVK